MHLVVKPQQNEPLCKIFLEQSKCIFNPVYVVDRESLECYAKAVLFENTNQIVDQKAVPNQNCKGLVDV